MITYGFFWYIYKKDKARYDNIKNNDILGGKQASTISRKRESSSERLC